MELIFNFVMGIFLIFYLISAASLDKNTITGDIFGAGGFPILLGILGLGVLGFIVKNNLKDKTRVRIPMFDIKSSSGRKLIINVFILGGYLAVMNIFGFMISTLLFVFGSTIAIGYKKLYIVAFFTVILSVILVVVFGKVFFIPLPRGIGIFRELSYFIY